MRFNDVVHEYENHGRLSNRSVARLRDGLREADPFEAITVATDCAVFELAPEIAHCLDSTDPMVRWNAVGALFTRFRVPIRLEQLIGMAESDPDSMVRAIALCGVGEMLPKAPDEATSRRMATLLISTLENDDLFEEYRTSAYRGILAAMDVMPLDRPPAHKPLGLAKIDKNMVERFKTQYLRQ